ncbi:MAG: hypothetical protein U9O97_03750 [Elusimicrobiota bacterium]|nr:hypothetical protein [Elusimicrobiota bacterium]
MKTMNNPHGCRGKAAIFFKRAPAVIILFAAALLFFSRFTAVSYASTPPELEKIFDRAADKYLAKDWPGAIEDLKKVIAQDPGNLRAVGLLGRALDEQAVLFAGKGQLDKALRVVNEALNYSPELQTAAETKTKILKEIKKRDEKDAARRARRAYAEKKKREDAVVRRAQDEAYNKKIEDEKRQRELREKALLEQVERQDKEILDRKEEIEVLRQQTNMIATKWLIYFSIAVLLAIGVSYFISSKIVDNIASRMRRQLADSNDRITELVNDLAQKNNATESLSDLKTANAEIMSQLASQRSNPMEEKLLAQTENLIKVVEQSQGSSGGQLDNIEFDDVATRRVITDVSPTNRAKAKSVVSISQTINNPSLAARLIAPYLQDDNNRVRAVAVVEMFKFDSAAAENTLRAMTASGKKWDRLSAAWAAGEIAQTSVMETLEILIDDYEPLVKSRALSAAKKAGEKMKGKFPATLKVKLSRRK